MNTERSIRDAHERLKVQFSSLTDERTTPIYLLEHGLTGGEVSELSNNVSAALATYPFEGTWWRERYLPLLVVVTEIGYEYRGTGTDFWPRLQNDLQRRVSPEAPATLSRYFAEAQRAFNTVRRPDTRWARVFCHIAWPVTQAILPLELHGPLAWALGQIGFKVTSDTPDEQILFSLDTSARKIGRGRFNAWLADTHLATAVTRAFFHCEAQYTLQPATLSRIIEDLQNDPQAFDNLQVARARQRRMPTVESESSNPASASRRRRTGTLKLTDLIEEQPTLLGVLPRLEADIAAPTLHVLRRVRYMPRLWGTAKPITAARLLSGLPFELGSSGLPVSDVDLLPDLDKLPLERPNRRALASYRFELERPIVFRIDGTDESARQVRGRSLTASGRYWLFAESPYFTACPVERQTGFLFGLDHRILEAGRVDHAAWLDEVGFKVQQLPALTLSGVSRYGHGAAHASYQRGEPVAFKVRGPMDANLTVGLSGQPAEAHIAIKEDDILLVEDADDDVHVEVWGAGSLRGSVEIHREPEIASARTPVAWARLDPESPSVSALLGRRVSISVDSLVPLDEIQLEVSLSWDGGDTKTAHTFVSSPSVLEQDSAIWKELISDGQREALVTSNEATLTVRVRGLWSETFYIEESAADYRWVNLRSGTLVASTEAGPLKTEVFLRELPWSAAPRNTTTADGVCLHVASPEGRRQWGALCIAPSKMRLDEHTVKRPKRLLRQRDSTKSGVGALDVAEAYLRWATAVGTGLVAEVERGRCARELESLLVEVLCGERWASLEHRTRESWRSDFWDTMFNICAAEGVGYDQLAALEVDEEPLFRSVVRRSVEAATPEFWTVLEGQADVEINDFAECLDVAFDKGYQAVAQNRRGLAIRDASVLDDADPGSASEEWQVVLEAAFSQSTVEPLCMLLCPTNGADDLRRTDFASMTISDAAELLRHWASVHYAALQGRSWSLAELQAGLEIWVAPDRAIHGQWRSAVQRGLVDRWTARAVRYVAIRLLLVRRQEMSNGR